MADSKNKNFYVKTDTKNDKRLTEMLKRMKVIDNEDVEARLSGLKDSDEQKRVVTFEEVSKKNDN